MSAQDTTTYAPRSPDLSSFFAGPDLPSTSAPGPGPPLPPAGCGPSYVEGSSYYYPLQQQQQHQQQQQQQQQQQPPPPPQLNRNAHAHTHARAHSHDHNHNHNHNLHLHQHHHAQAQAQAQALHQAPLAYGQASPVSYAQPHHYQERAHTPNHHFNNNNSNAAGNYNQLSPKLFNQNHFSHLNNGHAFHAYPQPPHSPVHSPSPAQPGQYIQPHFTPPPYQQSYSLQQPPNAPPSYYPSYTNSPTHTPAPTSAYQSPKQQPQPQQLPLQQPPLPTPRSLAAPDQLKASEPSSAMPPRKAAQAAAQPEIMPSPVRTKFPTARIKRIMQADEEVGKVAQQTPIAVGKALELFMVQLVTKSAEVAKEKNSKRITAPMLKQAIDSANEWDFLQDIVAKVTEEKEGAKGAGRAKAESESDEELDAAEVRKKGRGGGRKKKGPA
ncbi:hypothetical protein F4780DRAFT_478570 [Xylariomycetidae sp. FL0641]|nr:hypothetical protein F4780DRAFT_478570 [Xylariomycetidae sp. FL0641]